MNKRFYFAAWILLAALPCIAGLRHWGMDREVATNAAPFRSASGERIVIQIGDSLEALDQIANERLPYGKVVYLTPQGIGTNAITKLSVKNERAWFFLHDGHTITNIIFTSLQIQPSTDYPSRDAESRVIGPLIIEDGTYSDTGSVDADQE